MMDVRWTITLRNEHQTDASCLAKLAAVSIVAVEQERVDDFTVCNDVTAKVSAGVFTRDITASTTAAFDAKFPTDENKISSLSEAFHGVFEMTLPSRVEENLTLNSPCP